MTTTADSFPISPHTRHLLQILGHLIRIARIEQHMTQAELGERIDVSRATIAAIEKGKPNVAIGSVFEAATIVDVPLMGNEPARTATLAQVLAKLVNVLPANVGQAKVVLDDDF